MLIVKKRIGEKVNHQVKALAQEKNQWIWAKLSREKWICASFCFFVDFFKNSFKLQKPFEEPYRKWVSGEEDWKVDVLFLCIYKYNSSLSSCDTRNQQVQAN